MKNTGKKMSRAEKKRRKEIRNAMLATLGTKKRKEPRSTVQKTVGTKVVAAILAIATILVTVFAMIVSRTTNSSKVTDHIHQKYSNFEVENRHTKFDPQKMDDELESIDEIFQKNKKSGGKVSNNNNEENEFFEEEDKTEPQLKEFFKDVEDGEWSMDQEQGIETTTEQKKLKKGTKITEEQKFPIQNYNNKKYSNNYYKEENVKLDIKEQSDEEESEESPQYIIEVE